MLLSAITMPDVDTVAVRCFLQLFVILLAARLFGAIARRLGQPQVVGEMIAGVALGPSLFGAISNGAFSYVFPWTNAVDLAVADAQEVAVAGASKAVLYSIAQVGLALYMFVVGLEFRSDIFASRKRSAIAVSVSGVAFPFLLGVGIAMWLFRYGTFFTENVSRGQAALFVGASMSITAFPMLARIIHERGLAGTSFGTLSLAAGAIDDATAWVVLSLVLVSFSGKSSIAIGAIGGGAVYALVTLTLGRRLFARFFKVGANGQLSAATKTAIFAAVLLGAWWTDFIRIYAVFGAFIMGVAMPRGPVTKRLEQMIEPLVVVLFLPVFFAYSGINTKLSVVNSVFMVGVVLVVLIAACVGKGVGCASAAYLGGEEPRSALAIGALMNARGLMELIILNIGLKQGLIRTELFTVMVIMAVMTTLLASPIFDRLARGSGPNFGTLSPVGPDVAVLDEFERHRELRPEAAA